MRSIGLRQDTSNYVAAKEGRYYATGRASSSPARHAPLLSLHPNLPIGMVPGWITGSSPELCVKVRGSSSMLLLGCLGDLLRFEKREIQVATFAPDRSSP